MLKLATKLMLLICLWNVTLTSLPTISAELPQDRVVSSELQHDQTHHASSEQSISSTAVVELLAAHHEDCCTGDCEDESCRFHQCHFGHCNFMAGIADSLKTPDFRSSMRLTAHFYGMSVSLSGPKRPPRA